MSLNLRLGFGGQGGAGGGAPIEIIGIETGVVTNNSGDNVIGFASGTQEGDLAVVFMCAEILTGYTAPTGYSTWVNGGTGPAIGIFHKDVGASETSVTIAAETTANPAYDIAYMVITVRNVNATPLDVAIPTGTTSGATSITPPEITTATDGALVMVFAGHDDRGADTITSYPAGYGNTTSQSSGTTAGISCVIGFAAKIVDTAGTETPGAFVFSEIDGNEAHTIALRPA